MATTTPNFGWAVPTSTDLVKDGAVAIETLGDAIDASLLDLKGGTTNQVLAKNSNTDMDFKWVADASGISATIVDAKGDLIAGTAADTVARLAVGNNGETLVADNAATTGLRYSATPSASNPVLNSAMQVFQRGTSTSLAASTAYTSGFVADRWQTATGANQACTVSQQSTNDTTNLPFIQYCLRYQRNSGQTGTGSLPLVQNFETINSRPFAGKTITFSFYARAGANYSHTGSGLAVDLISGTGTDQNRLAGYTGNASVISSSATLTTTWQRFTFTGSVASTATELAIYLQFTPTGTAGAADYYEITGVQIDIGSVALPFRTYAATIQGELAACQRYYWRSLYESTYTVIGTGMAYSTGNARFFIPNPVQMRVQPTTLDYGGTNPFIVYDFVNANFVTGSTLTLENNYLSSAKASVVTVATGGTGLTQYRPYVLTLGGSGNSSQYIGFGAEL